VSLRSYRSAVVLVAALLTGIGIALAAHGVGIHAARVVSGSMSPSIDRGDWIVVGNLDHNDGRTIRRGEVVVFSYPLGTTGRAIKRVVAIGGDTVTVGADAVSVNGHPIPIVGAPSEAAARYRVEHVPEGDVFLLGDNAPVSIDSRSLGPVPDTDVVGRVLFVAPRPVFLSLLVLAIAITVLACGLAVARRRGTRPATRHFPPSRKERTHAHVP
jgi:signal peptidase I